MRDWPDVVETYYDRAAFIDRDGVVNVDTHYPHDARKLQMVPEAIIALKELTRLPLQIIIISNQGGIAKGIFTVEQMSEFNQAIRGCVENEGGHIDAFYYCPHGRPENLPPEVEPCTCRKPLPGMLLEAADDYEIDLQESFMIGDRTTDVQAGRAAGCTTIKTVSRNVGQDSSETLAEDKPSTDFNVNNLLEAVEIIKVELDANH